MWHARVVNKCIAAERYFPVRQRVSKSPQRSWATQLPFWRPRCADCCWMTGKPEIEVQPSLTASMGSYSSLRSATLRDQTLCALRKCKSPFSRATRHSRPQNDPGHKRPLMCAVTEHIKQPLLKHIFTAPESVVRLFERGRRSQLVAK